LVSIQVTVHKHWETQGNAAESGMPVSEIRTPHHTCTAQLRLISHFVKPSELDAQLRLISHFVMP